MSKKGQQQVSANSTGDLALYAETVRKMLEDMRKTQQESAAILQQDTALAAACDNLERMVASASLTEKQRTDAQVEVIFMNQRLADLRSLRSEVEAQQMEFLQTAENVLRPFAEHPENIMNENHIADFAKAQFDEQSVKKEYNNLATRYDVAINRVKDDTKSFQKNKTVTADVILDAFAKVQKAVEGSLAQFVEIKNKRTDLNAKLTGFDQDVHSNISVLSATSDGRAHLLERDYMAQRAQDLTGVFQKIATQEFKLIESMTAIQQGKPKYIQAISSLQFDEQTLDKRRVDLNERYDVANKRAQKSITGARDYLQSQQNNNNVAPQKTNAQTAVATNAKKNQDVERKPDNNKNVEKKRQGK